MKCLLYDYKLTFTFRNDHVTFCIHVYGDYQANEILSFAVIDLFIKIIKQQKRKLIILKKRKPILHLLNYIDMLNFISNEFNITFFSKNKYKAELLYNLYSYRTKPFKDFGRKNGLKVIENENFCVIRFEYDYVNIVKPKNVDLAAMVMHILKKEESDEIDVSSIIFYCVLLM